MSDKIEYKPPIWLGAIFWHELAEKSFTVHPIQLTLNEHIDLSDYGTGIQAIRFVAIAVRPTNKIHEAGIEYKPRKKELYINAKLDYKEVEEAPIEDVPKMVAASFVDRINRYEDVGVKDFDTVRFKRDVEQLFAGEGWLVGVDQG